MSTDTLLSLLDLIWAVFGIGILWLIHKVRKGIAGAFRDYKSMTRVILGDEDSGTVGIAERLNVMEQSEALNKEQRKQSETISNNVQLISSDLTRLREEVAVSTNSTESLRETVNQHSASLEFIRKELTHNGGGSVKDMARDAAVNSSRTLTLIRARDDMDSNTAYFVADAEGEYSWVSETFLNWTKYQQVDLHGFGWMNAVYPEDRGKVREEWDNAIADDRDFMMEYRMWTKQREPFWVRAMAKKMPGHTGAVTGWYGSVQRMSPEDIAAHLAEIE